MAKTNQPSGSAAQRRSQVRQQRQQRLDKDKVYPKAGNKRGQKKANNPWPMVIGILGMCVLVIGIFIWLSQQPVGGSSKAALNTIEHIDPNLLETVGAGSAKSTFKAVPPNADIPKGPTGKPEFFYFGALYCPYCAAQRWAIITTLSRFGTFGPIDQMTSSESNVPTFTFQNVKYTSNYIDFVHVESTDNNGNTLDTPTTEQAALVTTYDAPPYTTAAAKSTIPFILVGNKLVSNGAFYDPQTLVGLSYDQINSKITDSTSDISRGMLGAANDLTAAICQAIDNQNGNVCNSAVIQSIEKTLPSPASASAMVPQFVSVGALSDMVVRKQN